ncbi:MAG: secretin N-terminal domain-containing protein [Planctomycetota bacterium]|jgi:hypothetical protein
MKTRTLVVVILGFLVVASVSPAQETVAPEQVLQEPVSVESPPRELHQEPSSVGPATPPPGRPAFPGSSRRYGVQPTPPSAVVAPPRVSKTPTEVIIFELKHADPTELANLIGNIFRVTVHVDGRRNRLVVSATKEQIRSIGDLIAQMDVGLSEASTPRDTQDLIYRIYMFEIPSEDDGMKAFSLGLQTSVQVSSQEFLDATADKDLRIIGFLQTRDGPPDAEIETLIQGRATSEESVRRMVEKFPESRITELKWDDDETFTNKIAAAQYTQLPEQMQKHIRKFLGNDIRTVGYWFGNVSVPGQVNAPIGPWSLELMLDTESDRMVQLQVDVEAVGEEEQIGEETWRQQIDEILSNTIIVKIGKPIIIGYNRQSYGRRKMGAMVIVPEADSFESDPAGAKSF